MYDGAWYWSGGGMRVACAHALAQHAGIAVVRAQNMCQGCRSRPSTLAEAVAGLRPRTCVTYIYVHACLWPRAGRGRGRRDRPRPEAKTSVFGARMTLPSCHMRVNVRTGP
eukprot:350709-Chlamydomonas_euryale.AAC.2